MTDHNDMVCPICNQPEGNHSDNKDCYPWNLKSEIQRLRDELETAKNQLKEFVWMDGTEEGQTFSQKYDAMRIELEQHQWVKCSERLPEQNTDVLVMTSDKGPRIAYQDEDGWFNSANHAFYGGHSGPPYKTSVTHWKPITPPIEADTGEQK